MDDMLNETGVDTQEDQNEEGASMVEYALLVALIAIIAIIAIRFLGFSVSSSFSLIGNQIQ